MRTDGALHLAFPNFRPSDLNVLVLEEELGVDIGGDAGIRFHLANLVRSGQVRLDEKRDGGHAILCSSTSTK